MPLRISCHQSKLFHWVLNSEEKRTDIVQLTFALFNYKVISIIGISNKYTSTTVLKYIDDSDDKYNCIAYDNFSKSKWHPLQRRNIKKRLQSMSNCTDIQIYASMSDTSTQTICHQLIFYFLKNKSMLNNIHWMVHFDALNTYVVSHL